MNPPKRVEGALFKEGDQRVAQTWQKDGANLFVSLDLPPADDSGHLPCQPDTMPIGRLRLIWKWIGHHLLDGIQRFDPILPVMK